jgi:hypothetical protein
MSKSLAICNEKGNIVLSLVASGVVLTLLSGVVSLLTKQSQSLRYLQVDTAIENVQELVRSRILNEVTWRRIVNHGSNSNALECLSDGTIPSECRSDSSGPTDVSLRLIEADGTTLYNSSNPQSGFTMDAVPCNGFNPDDGNDDCPLRIDFQTRNRCYAVGGNACGNVTLDIIVNVSYRPEGIGFLQFNTEARSFVVNREPSLMLSEDRCYSVNGDYDQGATECRLPFPDYACPQGQAMRGFTEDGGPDCQNI